MSPDISAKYVPAKRRTRRGFVTVYLTFGFMALIPIAGLAIDVSVLYNVRAKLQSACDAAAIGAGAILQRSASLNQASAVTAIQDSARKYFNANYPAAYWGSNEISYSATPSEDVNTKIRTIVVQASERVPSLFLRVLGINASTVAASATVSVRFLTMMIVVDRSGSVQRGGADAAIRSSLNTFVTSTTTSFLVDGRDVVGMGSFGGNWNLDFPPIATFRSGGIGTAIANLPFGNSPTNTAEGLYRAYTQLQTLNQPGALNVIVLLTDGRPSALTVTTDVQSTCTTKGVKTGFITATVGQDWPPLPPQTQGGSQGSSTVYNLGLFNPVYSDLNGVYTGSDMKYVTNSVGCRYASDPAAINQDISTFVTFPTTDSYGNSVTGPIYYGEGQSMSNPRAVRFAAFNAADNQATKIRQDTALRPVLFVIGLNEPPAGGEPLDADWLARVANDPLYKDSFGNSVVQAGQTKGKYYNVSAAGLAGAFQDISSQLFRLAQ